MEFKRLSQQGLPWPGSQIGLSLPSHSPWHFTVLKALAAICNDSVDLITYLSASSPIKWKFPETGTMSVLSTTLEVYPVCQTTEQMNEWIIGLLTLKNLK